MNKIIHQIWIADSEDMMPCNLRILSNTWKKYNPDWDYHLWCSAEVESLLFSDFSDFYLLYKSVFTQRQRLNLAKYMILYLHGGLYVNLDTECFQSISPLFNDSQLFFTNQPKGHCDLLKIHPLLGNSFIGSTAKNVFWIFLLSQIEESIHNKTFFYGENNLGALKITRYLDYMKNHFTVSVFPSKKVMPVSQEEFKQYSLGLNTDIFYKKIKEAFNMCFNFAVYEEGLVEPYENPTLGVVMPIYDMTLDETPAYNTDEIKKITNECLKKTSTGKYVYKYGPLFLFMLNTGLREGEACALLKSDVNLQDRLVSVNKNIISVRSGKEDDEKHWIKKVKNTPKTKNSIRYVPLNKGAVKYANIVLDQFGEGEMFVYTINGRLVNPSSLNKYLDTILKNAGVNKKGGVHVLRDTFASRLFDSGTDIQTISKILGHANSRITEEHYIQILNSRKMKAVNLIDYI